MPERGHGGHRPRLVAGWLGVTLAVAACGIGLGSGEGGSPSTGPGSDPSAATRSARPSAVGNGAASHPSPTPSSSAVARLVVDPRLLAILPAQVDGIVVTPSSSAADAMTGDAALEASASALAVGVAAAPGGSKGDDLAIATVVQLRPGVYTDGFYGDWRKAYDEAACAPAGGVGSHLREVIGGRNVEVTLCFGGARTYHVYLGGDILISMTAVGPRMLGDKMLAGVRR